MKTYYVPLKEPFAIAGVMAVSMSDEQYDRLRTQDKFFDENSKEVQMYKAVIAEREAAQLLATEATQDAADEAEILTELVKEQFADKLAERLKERKEKRKAEHKETKGK